MAARRIVSRFSAIASVLAVVALAGPAVAAEDRPDSDPGKWYIVGSPGGGGTGLSEDRLDLDEGRQPVEFGLTFSRSAGHDLLAFTSGHSQSASAGQDGYSFLLSGAYDWRTGTVITPRVMAGVGVSYLEPGVDVGGTAIDPGSADDVAPTLQLGFGADIDIIGNWALSAEYRAFYQGATQLDGRVGEERLDQKFLLGAKIRF